MTDRAALLQRYQEASSAIERVMTQLEASDLDSREGAADWSPRQIVHHLADVEVGDAMRLRLMIAHDGPLITAYDEDLFASRLHYERPIDVSRALFCQLRASNTELIECLSEAEWSRHGWHEEHEHYSVEILVDRSIAHDEAHLAQIERALATKGRT